MQFESLQYDNFQVSDAFDGVLWKHFIPVLFEKKNNNNDVMLRSKACSTSFCHGMETLPVTNLW